LGNYIFTNKSSLISGSPGVYDKEEWVKYGRSA